MKSETQHDPSLLLTYSFPWENRSKFYCEVLVHLKHLDTTEQRNAETERATCKHQIFCSEKHVQSFVLKSTRTVMFLPNSQVLVLTRHVGITSDVTPAALTHLQCPSVWSKQSKHL